MAPKWNRFEFWPFQLFYTPVYFNIIGKAFKTGSLPWFTAANPGMDHGGFLEYSKWDPLSRLQPKYVPKTLVIDAGENRDSKRILKDAEEMGIGYPCFMKPDQGERGWNVQKITNREEAAEYLARFPGRILMQELAPGPMELGIMFVREPGEDQGKITSVVIKESLKVTGNGKDSLDVLAQKDTRAQYHTQLLRDTYGERMKMVPEEGEEVVLVDMGNHCKGATFLDGRDIVTNELTALVNDIVKGFEGFYIGRLDIRTPSLEDLLQGKANVIEVNGVNSEPAHIYDPEFTLKHAWSDLLAHWKDVYRVSSKNIAAGVKPDELKPFIKALKRHFKSRKEMAIQE